MADKRWHTLSIALNCADSELIEQSMSDVIRISAQRLSLAVADIALTAKPNNDALSITCSK